MKKTTPFGKYLRKIRIDHGTVLKQMAEELSVSSAYLSAIELGKKNVPNEFITKLSEQYSLDDEEKSKMEKFAEISKIQEKLDMRGNSDGERELVVSFARNYKRLSTEKQLELKAMLED